MTRTLRVLHIEDNPGDVALVRAALLEAGEGGFEFQHAPRLETGLYRLAAESIDVVLLDLGLPDSRGIETFQRARAAAPDVPIIVFSGLDDEDLALRAVQEGAQEYLVKGRFDGALLARAIRYAISRCSVERKLRETERRFRENLERQVQERTAELERTHLQLRLADRLSAIGTLAAGLGHDMNNMLLPVRCRLDALDAMKLPESACEQLAGIRRSAEYLQQLTDGLRLLALDPEDASASTESTNLESWWQQVGGLLSKAVQKPARLSSEISSGLPPVAVAGHRLTQAVLNLIVNAAEAVQERAASREDALVSIWAKPGAHGRILIGVTDNGRGMSDEVRRRATEPFFTTKTRGLGTGLGLALVRGVVAEAGGELHIESAPGEGTTISIELPAAQCPSPESASSRKAAITVSDPRAAAVLELVLREHDFQTSRTPPDAQTSLWVLEHDAAAQRPAAEFQRTGGALLWVGPSSENAGVAITDPCDLNQVRATVQQLLTEIRR